MIRYLYGAELRSYPALRDAMHRDRATQFHDRLGWNVNVDENGGECDAYDGLNPLYVIWEPAPGVHGGSMRFLPMDGRTMVTDHFAGLLDCTIDSPLIWECTRFCLAPDATVKVAGILMLAGGELMRGHGLTHLLGVFDARMIRIYNAIGAAPQVLGSSGTGRDRISVGLWPYRPTDRLRVLRRAGVSSDVSELWFRRAFGRPVTPPLVA
ncbi:acyl-homoserine-lactone synthase [Loktanella sp. SALINAS62]|uniref:acyl-homoserine-lactone synthase n=1 Tax=Loktanella sp. SALINAS62 TaxID=2706124 RepID=UPI001B8D8ECA|nr:acyl-homoserine-lactone synthase [Loktanella sp. SALINAS62]MBS1301339.1 autoinducer synthase [Loktanella sp. SALINAS62]